MRFFLRKGAWTVSSPPGEDELVEEVVAPGQEAPLCEVRLDAHSVAPTLQVHLHTVQQVFDRRHGLPRPERHHGLLVLLQAVDGVVIETQILLRVQHADQDGGVASGDGLGSGDTNQHLEGNVNVVVSANNVSLRHPLIHKSCDGYVLF